MPPSRTGKIETARERLPHLCGRDPQALGADGIARRRRVRRREHLRRRGGRPGVGCRGRSPGLVGFRAVNTLDAMVGHRSPRYRRYGWASARLDDVAGWPGARLTAVLAALAGDSPRGALARLARRRRQASEPQLGPWRPRSRALGVRRAAPSPTAGASSTGPNSTAPGAPCTSTTSSGPYGCHGVSAGSPSA